jgi:hypothetical protein
VILKCATSASPQESERQLVAANGGRPVFISAGPDRRFGETDPSAAADDIMLQPAPAP